MLIGFDGAKIHFFPDIPAVSAEILALRGWEGEKRRAEAASLVEGSCVPSVASDQRSSATFRSYSLLISFFYTKGTVPFVLLPHVLHCRSIRWRVNRLFLHCRSPRHCSDWGERKEGGAVRAVAEAPSLEFQNRAGEPSPDPSCLLLTGDSTLHLD